MKKLSNETQNWQLKMDLANTTIAGAIECGDIFFKVTQKTCAI